MTATQKDKGAKRTRTPELPHKPKKPSKRQKREAAVRELELLNPIPFPRLEGKSPDEAKSLIGTWKAKRKAALIVEAAKNPSMLGALVKVAYRLSGKKTKSLTKVKALVRRARKKLNRESAAANAAPGARLEMNGAAAQVEVQSSAPQKRSTLADFETDRRD